MDLEAARSSLRRLGRRYGDILYTNRQTDGQPELVPKSLS